MTTTQLHSVKGTVTTAQAAVLVGLTTMYGPVRILGDGPRGLLIEHDGCGDTPAVRVRVSTMGAIDPVPPA